MNDQLKEYVKHETKFCEEHDIEKNEHGVYLYISQNGVSQLSLDFILREYRDWLIEEGIVKQVR